MEERRTAAPAQPELICYLTWRHLKKKKIKGVALKTQSTGSVNKEMNQVTEEEHVKFFALAIPWMKKVCIQIKVWGTE